MATGCGKSKSSDNANAGTTTSTTAGQTTTSSAANAGITKAEAELAKFRVASTGFTAPGPALTNVASLKGKVVYYVPIALQVPFFQGVIAGMKDSLAAVGMTLRVCDGAANPSAAAKCLDQAVGEKAGAVVTDSIPVEFASNAFTSVQNAKIPVVLGNQPYPDTPGTKAMAYLSYDGPKMLALVADAVISDSKGKANVLINEVNDSIATTIAIDKGALPEFQQLCPACKVTVNKFTTANYSTLPSLTATAFAKEPDINYVIPQFDSTIQGTLPGLQTAGVASKVKMATSTSTLLGLQMIKDGKLIADVGFDSYKEGWAYVDQAMRMMLGMDPVQKEDIGLRVFDSSNINDLKLTPEAANTGEWFGPGAFKTEFKKLWGVGA